MERAYKNVKKCRSCFSDNLETILSLGKQYVVGFTSEDTSPVEVPLTIMLCNHCHLIQLKQTTKPELLWNAEYGYRSGINDTMRYELKSIALQAEQLTGLGQEDIVLDIGCNDGTLLDSYSNPNIIRVGYDPSHNVISIADQLLKKYGEDQYSLFTDFFTSLPYNNLFKKKAKVVTAIAMFYDLNDPNTFLKDVCEVLDDDGIFIIQQNYLMGMIQFNAFDNILHEHLEYYSLHSLSNLLKKHNLEVFDVLTNNINGGSFRTLIKKRGAKMKTSEGQENVAKMLKSEKAQGLINKNIYHEFAKNVKENGNRLKDFLTREVKRGKKIYVYGASTRGNTLLQYFGIDHSLVTAAAERNPYKWGKKTVGTNIPIVSETEARNARPDYFLALPWYFRNEFIKRERQYLSQGGKFIFPLPKFEVFHL